MELMIENTIKPRINIINNYQSIKINLENLKIKELKSK